MRALLRLLLLAVAPVLVVVAPGAAPSHACSCIDTPVDQLLADADVVFVGTVLEDPVGADDGQAAFRVEATSVYAGVVPEVVQLTTDAETSACGIDVSEGDRWTFVTTTDFVVGSCDGSAPTSTLTASDVERVLGPSGPPEPGGVARPDSAEEDSEAATVVTRLFVGLVVVIGLAGAVLLLLMLRSWARNQR
jgi:hypothetical protein